jgi:hypothetical protein
MTKYSKKLHESIDIINETYLENGNLYFLQNIMMFFAEGIEYIDEHYLVVSKEYVKNIVNKAQEIWANGGENEKLEKLNTTYTKELNEIKPFKNILKNKEERAAMDCVLTVLSNSFDSAKEWLAYDFIESYLLNMETLNIEEDTIKILLKKYFGEIIK